MKRENLLAFVLFALAKYGEPRLRQPVLQSAVSHAFQDPDGRMLADVLGLPSPELKATLSETVGAFGDWLRHREIVQGCGFSAAGTTLTCRFEDCAFFPAARGLVSGPEDSDCPCVLMALLGALLRARGTAVDVESCRVTEKECVWMLDVKREDAESSARK